MPALSPPATASTVPETCGVAACANHPIYQCPRCGMPYCSVSCYRVHSDACVASFTAEDEHALLRRVRATDDEKASMRAILDRLDTASREAGEDLDEHAFPDLTGEKGDFWEEQQGGSSSEEEGWGDVDGDGEGEGDSDSGQEGGDYGSKEEEEEEVEEPLPQVSAEVDEDVIALEGLLEEMKHFDLSFDEALSRLPPNLSEDFQQQLSDGRIASVVPPYKPWWLQSEEGGNSDDEDESGGGRRHESNAPRRPRAPATADFPISPDAAYASADSLLVFSVLEVVAAYCGALRACNGDWAAAPAEAAVSILSRSRVLSDRAVVASAVEAVGGDERSGRDVVAVVRAGWAGCVLLEVGDVLIAGVLEAQGIRGGKRRRLEAQRSRMKLGFLIAYATAAHEAGCLGKTARELEEWMGNEDGGEEPKAEETFDKNNIKTRL